MADFPVFELSGAVSKVVSSVIPPRAYTFVAALIPGLFFEVSILVANPALACELRSRAQDGLGLGRYAVLGVALVFAFVLGNAFILSVTLIQRLFGLFYRLRAWLWKELCGWPLFPFVNWLYKKPWWARRRWLIALGYNVQRKRLGQADDEGARRLWALIARRLLEQKYGIDHSHFEQGEWNALYWALGTLTINDVRGSLVLLVFEATGWCGVSAILLAPTLANRYFIGLCVILILAGLYHDWYVAEGLNNPQFLGVLKVRSLLREFQGAAIYRGNSLLKASGVVDGDDPAADAGEI
jgi:hypothetical protein